MYTSKWKETVAMLKKLFLIFLIGALAFLSACETFQKQDNLSEQESVSSDRNLSLERPVETLPTARKYFLHDMDQNGADELIIGEYISIGGTQQYDANSEPLPRMQTMMIEQLYTKVDGKTVPLQINWPNAVNPFERAILSNGLIRCVNASWDDFDIEASPCYYLSIEGGNRVVTKHAFHPSSQSKTSYIYEYWENGEYKSREITLEQIKQLRAEIEHETWVITPQWEQYANNPYFDITRQEVERWNDLYGSERTPLQVIAKYDIDKNGTEEEIVGQYTAIGGTQQYDANLKPLPCMQTMMIEQLYTKVDGKTVPLQIDWPNAVNPFERVILSNGLIRCINATWDNFDLNESSYFYLAIEHGEVVRKYSLCRSSESKTGYLYEYRENGEYKSREITLEQKKQLRAEIEKGAHLVHLDWQ